MALSEKHTRELEQLREKVRQGFSSTNNTRRIRELEELSRTRGAVKLDLQ